MRRLYAFAALAAAVGIVALPPAAAVNGFYTWTYPPGPGTIRALNSAGVAVGELPLTGGPVVWDAAGMHAVPSTSTGAALDINDDGVVVGYRDDWTAFRWSATDGVVDLGRGWARAVNANGVVVGDDTTHPVVWWPDGSQTDLFAGRSDHGTATDVNDLGEVVGRGTRDDGTGYVFVWTQEAGLIEIAQTSAALQTSQPLVNAAGTVASTYTLNGSLHGFVWDAGRGLTDLGTLVPNGLTGVADLNDSGTVVGWSLGPSSPVPAQHAFVWTRENGMVDLGTLGGRRGFATAINNAGEVAGYAMRAGSTMYHAFVWTSRLGMQDLGFTQESEAYAIGENGWVAGSIGTPFTAPQPIIWQPRGSDTNPPTIVVPDSLVVEASSAAGAVAAFSVTATDDVTPSPWVVCDRGSGTLFPLGETMVSCTARDDAGNEANGAFVVHVVDTTPPTLTIPPDRTSEATTSDGAAVAFTVSATDTVDPAPVVTCTAVSGATFPLGATTVHCSATDWTGNLATGSFSVTVRDTTAPTLLLPLPLALDAESPTGAAASYVVRAVDAVDPQPVVTCSSASSTVFAIGDTAVDCTASDMAGNVAVGTFTVHVRGAAEQLERLVAAVRTLGLPQGIETSLLVKLPGQLSAFANEVRAQAGKTVPPNDAADLVARAERIRAVLG